MSSISHRHARLLQFPPPVTTLPQELLNQRVHQSPQQADWGKIQVAINFFSTNYQIANLLFNCTLFEGGHCVAGTYFCLWITEELCGSYFWWLGNGELSSGAKQQYPRAATLVQPLVPALATFTPANTWVVLHPKCLFPPPRAEPHAEAEPGATHGLPIHRVGTKLCGSSQAVHPASLVSQLAPLRPEKARHPSQPRGTSHRAAGPVQELACLVCCHRAGLAWWVTQS